MLFETIYKIRIVYKGGTTMDFEVTDFALDTSSNDMSWAGANEHFRPLRIGVDEIAAVWVVGERRRLKKFW